MDLRDATIKYVNMGQNHAQKQWILYTDKDEERIVKAENYGANRIAEERTAKNAQIAYFTNLVKQDEIDNLNNDLSELDILETKLNKEV